MQLKNRRRRGFTLIELLVVLAIIAVLVSLTAAAVMRFRGTGLASATRTNLGKSHAKLNEQWKGVTDGAHKDSLSAPGNTAYVNAALTAGTNVADERVRRRYVQLRQTQAFPVDFHDAFWPLDRTPQATAPVAWPAYVSYLADLGVTPANEATWRTAIPPEVQASVCLLMILTVGPKNTGVTADDLGSAVGPVQLSGVTPRVTPRGMVDAWQTPVTFTRRYQNKDANLAVQSAGNDKRFNTNDDIVASNP